MPSATTRHSRTTRGSKTTRVVRGGQAAIPVAPPPPNSVTVGATVRTSALRPGLALVGNDTLRNTAANPKSGTVIANSIAVMGASVSDVIVHAISFGQRFQIWPAQATTNPAQWAWSDLDERVTQIESAGCRAYVMLGQVPQWMVPGLDINTQFYPNANAADAATFARNIATRYAPGGVTRVYGYCIYNELKGLWSVGLNRVRYEDMTTIYNGMYSAVKGVSSSIKFGGPYFPTPGRVSGQAGYVASGAKYINTGVGYSVDTRDVDAFNYWNANKTGADFVCFDGCNRYTDNLANWLLVTKGVTLPIMWAEFYSGNGADPYYSGTPTTKEKSLRLIHNMIIAAYAGAGPMCVWGGDAKSAPPFPENALWNAATGAVTDTGSWLKILKDNFVEGTTLKAFTSNNAGIVGIASDTKVMILNKTNVDQVTDTPGGTVTLGAKTVTLQ